MDMRQPFSLYWLSLPSTLTASFIEFGMLYFAPSIPSVDILTKNYHSAKGLMDKSEIETGKVAFYFPLSFLLFLFKYMTKFVKSSVLHMQYLLELQCRTTTPQRDSEMQGLSTQGFYQPSRHLQQPSGSADHKNLSLSCLWLLEAVNV